MIKATEPKNLGVQIGSKLERFWADVRDSAKTALDQGELSVILQKEVIKLAEKKVKAEQDTFKKT